MTQWADKRLRGKMTREEIQAEYNKATAILGERVYRMAIPALELFGLLQRLLSLNQQMGEVLEKENKQNVLAEKQLPLHKQEDDSKPVGGEATASNG